MASEDASDIDISLLLGLTQRRMSRLDLLKYAGAGAGALSFSSFLAACGGIKGAAKHTGSTKTGVGSAYWWAKQKQAGVVNFANWPLYIDVAQKNGHTIRPSLQEFTKKTGIQVNYKEVIQDYPSWFGKLHPQLAAGQNVGYDLIVMGYPRWLPLTISLGYLIPLDHSLMPNFEKYGGSFIKNPGYDPGNTYSVPWQSGITGIGYNPKLTGREITSIKDLMDPAFKGKVGMFDDTEDLPNMALLGIGVNPVTSTEKDWHKAAKLLLKQKSEGIVRQYYGQSYIDSLTKGDVYLSMAYSGDIFQANLSGAPDLKFVVPKEGGLLWTDSMCIPQHASHPLDAIKLMDWVYKPDIAAMITEYVHYIAPVPASQSIIERAATAASSAKLQTRYRQTAHSPIVFPSKEALHRLSGYRNLTQSEQTTWDHLFEPIYQA